MEKLAGVTKTVERWRMVWLQIKKHKIASTIIGFFAAAWAIDGFIWGHTPLEAIQIVWASVLPMLTLANVFYVGLLAVWAVAAFALISDYYAQRAKVAVQEVRVMERERDINVLTKRVEQLQLRVDVTDLALEDSRAKVLELQQEQNSHPLQVQQLREEMKEVRKQHAHVSMERLALIAELKGWNSNGQIKIVVRFLEYADRKLADEIAAYITHYAPWTIDVRHEPGSTIRPSFDSSRVEVAPARNSHLSGIIAHCLASSGSVDGRVHHVNGDPEGPYCVITVFPRGHANG